jgi:predicted phosphate transport protein (TIGR00153 family)
MTVTSIEAIIFDVGGTLRETARRAPREKPAYTQKICELLGTDIPAEQMLALLELRAKAYKAWSKGNAAALDEAELWTQWLLPDWPPETVRALAIPLNKIWRDSLAVRRVRPEVRPVMLELRRRGYRLGIASNTISSTEVPEMLAGLGLSDAFECVALSCLVKSRKPEPGLLLAASAGMGVAPERCAYVGNRAEADVPAARKAGFQAVVLMRSSGPLLEPGSGADFSLGNLSELLEVFPARPNAASARKPRPLEATSGIAAGAQIAKLLTNMNTNSSPRHPESTAPLSVNGATSTHPGSPSLLRRVFRKPENVFAKLIIEQSELTLAGLNDLVKYMDDESEAAAAQLMAHEKKADEVRRILIEELTGTFVTPYDREDIYTLSRAIDDVLDYAYSTVTEMALFEVRATPHMQRMASLLRDAGGELMLAVTRLQQHGRVASEHMRRAKKLENKVEAEYRLALAAMFKDISDVKQVVEVMKMREVYRHLSNAADRVDEAANVIAHIVIKSM